MTRPRYGECPQVRRHVAHQWTGGVANEVRYRCDGVGSDPSTELLQLL